jgi:hypothetical protein
MENNDLKYPYSEIECKECDELLEILLKMRIMRIKLISKKHLQYLRY